MCVTVYVYKYDVVTVLSRLVRTFVYDVKITEIATAMKLSIRYVCHSNFYLKPITH